MLCTIQQRDVSSSFLAPNFTFLNLGVHPNEYIKEIVEGENRTNNSSYLGKGARMLDKLLLFTHCMLQVGFSLVQKLVTLNGIMTHNAC